MSVKNHLFRYVIPMVGGALAACATQPPVPFQLIDQGSVAHAGTYNPNDQSMDVSVGGKAFHGFYIIATGAGMSTSDALFPHRVGSVSTFSQLTSNSARAMLRAEDGESISCQFLFQDGRAIGDCNSSAGKTYQFVATGRM